MIHVQNWKIYASHYNDDSTDLGLEVKKAQLHYKQYGEQMGVPVTEDIVCRAKRPSVDDIFLYLFDGTSLEDYHQAQFIEQNYNCITFREWQEREGTLKQATTASVPTTSVEIITAGAAADSDYVSPFQLLTGSDCADDLFEMTNNNSDEMVGDILNDVYRNDVGIDSPMKKKQILEYETPSKPRSNELLRFKNTHTFLSPTATELQRSIEKAASSVKVIYNTNELKAARKNILQSVNHILNHDLVMENPKAAAFVAEMERKVQEIKEDFTKTRHSITGTMNGNDGELIFPSFESRKRKRVEKRFKGLSG